jgi:predicted molibdopterin-dependent oxidoreductase YjgC
MMAMKMTQAIRKAIGDEAASDFEILFDENILTKAEFNEKVAQLKMELTDRIANVQIAMVKEISNSGRTILLWMMGILIPMWVSIVLLILFVE